MRRALSAIFSENARLHCVSPSEVSSKCATQTTAEGSRNSILAIICSISIFTSNLVAISRSIADSDCMVSSCRLMLADMPLKESANSANSDSPAIATGVNSPLEIFLVPSTSCSSGTMVLRICIKLNSPANNMLNAAAAI